MIACIFTRHRPKHFHFRIMKRLYLILVCAALIFLSGCRPLSLSNSEGAPLLSAVSAVEPADCNLCGENPDFLITYYGLRKSIGFLNLNSFDMCDVEIKGCRDGESPEEGMGGAIANCISCWDGVSVFRQSDPDRNSCTVTIFYAGSLPNVDYAALSKKVCQRCLDSVLRLDNAPSNQEPLPAIVLVDFSARELYPLTELPITYSIGGYTADITHNESRENVRVMITDTRP